MKSEGGFIWACKNYDGDVQSDSVAQGKELKDPAEMELGLWQVGQATVAPRVITEGGFCSPFL